MINKTATIIGATGLIGGHILEFLQEDPEYSIIKVIARKPVKINHPKVRVSVIDYSDENGFREAVSGSDVVFVAVGTTQKKVKGDKAAYRKVDYDIPVNAARFCRETGCPVFLVVSSVGADSKSGNFYLKLKGETEDAIQLTGVPSINIFRPSMLLGNRNESRPAESIAQLLSKGLSFLFPSKYKPVQAWGVAKAMIIVSKQAPRGILHYHYQEIDQLIK